MNVSNSSKSHETSSSVKNLNVNANNSEPAVTVASIDSDFLPLIYDVVRSIEREMLEGSKSLSRESQDYHLKVQALKEKLDKCRNQINSVKGIDMTKEEQIKLVDILKEQMSQKRELLSNYKNRCPIEGVPRAM